MKNSKKVSAAPKVGFSEPYNEDYKPMTPKDAAEAMKQLDSKKHKRVSAEIPLSRIAPNSIGLIRQALDAMAVALANHNHRWTARDRKSYEKAVKILAK